MPEVVADMPGAKKYYGGKYAKFFDGQVWKLTPDDFEGKTAVSTRSSIINAAGKAGVNIISRVRDGCLYVQAKKEP